VWFERTTSPPRAPSPGPPGLTSGAPLRALVTGGAGFIGSTLADRLASQGHQVTVLDNLSRRGSETNAAWLRERHDDRIKMVVGDVRDPVATREAARSQDVIYHLAAQTAVTTSVTDPRLDFECNAIGTFNVLEAARQAGGEPIFMYSSTNKVYGAMEDVPVVQRNDRHEYADLPMGVAETQPLDFHSPYGCSKGAADQYVHDYGRTYGLRSVVFRQSCIYGPRQMGVEDQGWVAWFIIAALTERPITIYGDGKQVRDVLYIDDLLNAFIAATERIEVASGQTYNIGGGPANTLAVWSGLKPLLEEILGTAIEPAGFADWRVGDQKVFISDIRKAERELAWTPRIPPPEGIARLVEWVRANIQLFAA
jgi:CDP-paratose 2-epimerase